MSNRSVVRGSFTITRNWKSSPAKVFAAFATEEAKAKWFGGPSDWQAHERSFDFREGGRETASGRHPNGMVSSFDCVYRDIVEPSSMEEGRIVYSYVMHIDGRKISVSQACIEFQPDGRGTRLVLHEYGDFLDGYDDAGSREHGTNFLMDALAKSIGETA
jgi:uncharacterized protein YndB with AHSA1/START domain